MRIRKIIYWYCWLVCVCLMPFGYLGWWVTIVGTLHLAYIGYCAFDERFYL